MKLDAHQHFWHYDPIEYDWIDQNMATIQRSFLPQDLQPVLTQHDLDACIAVQARQSNAETHWLLSLAEQHDFIKGVVGWIDLKADNLKEQLTAYKGNPKLVGFRHVLQGEPDPNFMLDVDFIRGLHTIQEHGYRYDLLIFAKQLSQSIELMKHIPNLPIVVDHIAKPDITTGSDFETWQSNINTLATHPHVFCKISGMVTEADWVNWQPQDFDRYMHTIFNAFGPDRIMFGSDWPVCLVAAQYTEVHSLLRDYVSTHYADHHASIFGGCAQSFYRIIEE